MRSKDCSLCGIESTPGKVCKKCSSLINASLSKAYLFWREAISRYGDHSGKLVRSAKWAYFYFRADNWKCYPIDQAKPERGQTPTPILMGLVFDEEGTETGEVSTFNEHPRGGGLTSFGDHFSYPKDVKDKKFWKKLEKQLQDAALAVDSDLIDDWETIC